LLVFNYGSNLSKDQFARRCPTARLVGLARIKDYRLTFTGWSFGRKGSVATIVPDEGHEAHGAVYSLRSPEDVRALDDAEGFPSCYGCEEFVALVKLKGRWRKRKVWAYVKVDDREGQPSNDYLKTVAQGYKDHGIDVKHLAAAVAALPATWHKPKPKPKRFQPASSYANWSWDKGWSDKKDRPASPKAKPARKKDRHKHRKKGKKANVVYVTKCHGGRNGNCDEDLVDPCQWCAPGAPSWHCNHCCPKASAPTTFY
jgi:hypothetical protein